MSMLSTAGSTATTPAVSPGQTWGSRANFGNDWGPAAISLAGGGGTVRDCESLKQALLTPFPALSGSPHCWGPFVTVQETFGTGVVPETRGHQVLSGWALCWHPASWKKVPMFRGLCECVRPWDMWSILGLPEGKCFSGLTLFCGLWCLLQQRTIWCKDFILGHGDTV